MSKEQIRQTAKYYKEGETKGNLTKSMKKAKYANSTAETHCDRMARNGDFKAAVAEREAEIDQVEGIKIEVVAQRHEELYKACIEANDRSNAARVLESEAKHVGFYKEDNRQQAEQRQLDEKERIEADRLAQIRLMQPAG